MEQKEKNTTEIRGMNSEGRISAGITDAASSRTRAFSPARGGISPASSSWFNHNRKAAETFSAALFQTAT
jgi:hypothetical protein